ncbi:hypothetical protein TRAPUB_10040 [Trametes pubescens]|uniref:Uncharacterized protein n=1 Tax=Trametes pubescens TaxID=154538 RepID=A0A1M2W0L4_TRAPU|nr:hypothetical protein TRAPUB_10040 [Trametes pubescens]
MAGHHGSGFNPHLPGFKHKFLATTLGATMWFFIFYRARKDGAKLLRLPTNPTIHSREWTTSRGPFYPLSSTERGGGKKWHALGTRDTKVDK